ncbi:MAG: hypothetical protein J6A47_09430 [Bacilli bacterium]|nr:hypothetical protein [Bacilli bacterium]
MKQYQCMRCGKKYLGRLDYCPRCGQRHIYQVGDKYYNAVGDELILNRKGDIVDTIPNPFGPNAKR